MYYYVTYFLLFKHKFILPLVDIVSFSIHSPYSLFKPLSIQEGQEVAQRYTEKIIANRGQVSEEELQRLLNAHALSMQALRDRQKQEKAKMEEILEYKKRERLLKRRAEKQEAEAQADLRAQKHEAETQAGTRASSSATAATSTSKDSGIGEEGRRSAGDGQEDGNKGKEDEEYDSDSELSVSEMLARILRSPWLHEAVYI